MPGFCDGAAHQRRDPYRRSPYDTAVFVLQTPRGAERWRGARDDKFEAEVRAAFAACVPTEAAEGRQRRKRGRGGEIEHWLPGGGGGGEDDGDDDEDDGDDDGGGGGAPTDPNNNSRRRRGRARSRIRQEAAAVAVASEVFLLVMTVVVLVHAREAHNC